MNIKRSILRVPDELLMMLAFLGLVLSALSLVLAVVDGVRATLVTGAGAVLCLALWGALESVRRPVRVYLLQRDSIRLRCMTDTLLRYIPKDAVDKVPAKFLEIVRDELGRGPGGITRQI